MKSNPLKKQDLVIRILNYISTAFALALLALPLVIGKETFGAKNWFYVGGVSVQPSEFVKVAFIFVGAAALDKLQTKRNFIEFIV